MNRLKKIVLLLFFSTLFFSCDGTGHGDGSGAGQGSTSIIGRSMKVYDGDNTFLGYSTSASSGWVTILSTKNYFYSLRWNGDFYPEGFFFTEKNFQGEMFVVGASYYYGKSIMNYQGTLYTYRDLNSYGNVVIDSSINEAKSVWTPYQQNSDYTYDVTGKACVLRVISRSEAGIPEEIKLPLTLKD